VLVIRLLRSLTPSWPPSLTLRRSFGCASSQPLGHLSGFLHSGRVSLNFRARKGKPEPVAIQTTFRLFRGGGDIHLARTYTLSTQDETSSTHSGTYFNITLSRSYIIFLNNN